MHTTYFRSSSDYSLEDLFGDGWDTAELVVATDITVPQRWCECRDTEPSTISQSQSATSSSFDLQTLLRFDQDENYLQMIPFTVRVRIMRCPTN
jgi:hypothetical protein